MQPLIRSAIPSDEPAWRMLWGQYLAYYDVTLDPAVTAQTWNRSIDPASGMTARVAVDSGAIVGFAIHHPHETTWAKGLDCYLEDLFVTDAARGKGIGRALIEDLVTICKERGWARLYWMTHEGNARARKLYDGFTRSDDHLRYRITF